MGALGWKGGNVTDSWDDPSGGSGDEHGNARRLVMIAAVLAVLTLAAVSGARADKQAPGAASQAGSGNPAARPATAHTMVADPPWPSRPSTAGKPTGHRPSDSASPPQAAAAARAPTAPAPPFPAAARPRTGSSYWAVYLTVTRTWRDPRYAQALRDAKAAGYGDGDIVQGGISCDRGARTGFDQAGVRLDPAVDYATVKLFFRTRQQAEAFAAAYRPGVVATVPVAWSCGN